MTGITPSPSTLTLLLKSHTLTTFITVQPTTTIDALKSELVRLLRENERNLEFEVPNEVELGLMVDPDGVDVSKGWHKVLDDVRNVKEMGVKDWGLVAWRRKGGGRFVVEMPAEGEEEDGERGEEEEE